MRINILQHTPNERAGSILYWADERGHEVYTYHPYQFGYLPTADETDMLIILGGPMSANDDFPWMQRERKLVKELIERDIPMFGACFGAQEIASVLGHEIKKSPVKEVGWAPVYRQTDVIPGIPERLMALHWHEDTFSIPTGAELLFSSDALKNQGFVMNHRIIGLQFHFEPQANNVREMIANDFPYVNGTIFDQTAAEIQNYPVPAENKTVMFKLLDYISAPKSGRKDL